MVRLLPRAVAAAVVVLAACGGGSGLEGGQSELLGEADEGIDGVQAIRVADNDHDEDPIDYQLRPPAGGAHNPVWANCGFYDIPVPDEHVVHDLEHGAVWLAYSPDLDADELEVIWHLTRVGEKVVASPYRSLRPGEAVVATAWARQLRLDEVGDERLADFVLQYVDGSQAPEAGGSCEGSPVGEPVG